MAGPVHGSSGLIAPALLHPRSSRAARQSGNAMRHSYNIAITMLGTSEPRRTSVDALLLLAGSLVAVALLLEAARREIRRARRTEQGAARAELLNLVAHELRTPLGVSLGYLDLIEGEHLGPIQPATRSAIASVRSAVVQLSGLADGLLEAARRDDGDGAASRRVVDLAAEAVAAVDSVRPLLGEEHNLVSEVPDMPLAVSGDALRLRVLVRNLLENAIKYSPDGGEILCRLCIAGGTAELTVRDHGRGIEPDSIGRIFDRFSRADEGSSGLGLGLFLARSIAESHGGSIGVDSQSGATTFTVRLPALEGTAVGASAQVASHWR